MGNILNKLKGGIAIAIILSLVMSIPAYAAADTSGHWAEPVLREWQDKGLMSGYKSGLARPNAAVTRAEFVQLINKSQGFKKSIDVKFSDISKKDWYYNSIAIAMGEKYCTGYPDNTFRPNIQVNRVQAAVFVANAMNLKPNEDGVKAVTDSWAIPQWAKGSVGAVLSAGYMSGYPDGTFLPAKIFSRAEAVSTLDRAMKGAK